MSNVSAVEIWTAMCPCVPFLPLYRTVPPVSFYRYPVLYQNPLLPVNHGVVEVGRARDAHQPETKQ